MTPLRQQMIQYMTLAGVSEGSQDIYIGNVRTFLRHVKTPLEQVTEQQLTDYLLLRQKSARGTFTTSRAALTFLFRDTLSRPWAIFQKKCDIPGSFVSPTPCRMSESAP